MAAWWGHAEAPGVRSVRLQEAADDSARLPHRVRIPAMDASQSKERRIKMSDFMDLVKKRPEKPIIDSGDKKHVTLNTEHAIEQIKKFQHQIAELKVLAERHVIKDTNSQKQAVEMIAQVKKLHNAIEAKRKEIVKDPWSFCKKVNSFTKSFLHPLKSTEHILKGKIIDYKNKLDLERYKAEQEARKKQEELKKKLEEEARAAGAEPPDIIDVPVVIPKDNKIVKTDSGASAHIRKEWVGEVIDENKVPREYCSPDKKKIDAAVKMGVREIPGVKIYEKSNAVVRP